MDSKRAVLTALVTVTILPIGSGKSFDPDTVQVRWRGEIRRRAPLRFLADTGFSLASNGSEESPPT
ncbi:hypothetical protein E3T39_01880 [Cryobacterium suzukii]|uniref:Uncharacterized protein n=1 Tax=Cryobacterium suzukii TaxID=1259198 RepID=A0A4R9AJ87_9MICO|nr:hypothetical protein [Cryobacterium suzukii]TFD62712.1 hypothetical protein E3T39_01880 [Cryobacterium suzukii]